MRILLIIILSLILIGCSFEQETEVYHGFVGELIEKSIQAESDINFTMNIEESGSDSLKVGFTVNNNNENVTDILHSSSYPMLLIYDSEEMIQPSPDMLDNLIFFHDLVTTRIGAHETKFIKEIKIEKPAGSPFQLRAYMAYDLEREDSLHKDLHSITEEIVFE
ncbi:MAG: hypothetical protein WD357_00345 [Gracilimonas sp.]